MNTDILRLLKKINMKKVLIKIIYIFKKIIMYFIGKVDIFIQMCFSIFPIDEYCIVLESEGDFTDNIRTFYEYMIKNPNADKYKIVWMVHKPAQYQGPNNVKFVSRFGAKIHIKADYYTARCKYYIVSHYNWRKKWRKNQYVIHTTHSVAQLKAGAYKTKKEFDFILCCSEYGASVKKHNWIIDDKQILYLGMPRLDLLFTRDDRIKKIVKGYQNKKIILAMETFKQAKAWKDSENVDSYAINVVKSIEDMETLNAFLAVHDYVLIVKIHHLQDLSFLENTKFGNIIYLHDDDLLRADIQVNQLLTYADILLTDYSSVFYDYLLLDRPIGFLIGDMEYYSRGFLMSDPFIEMPGEKISTLDELQEFISKTIKGEDDYRTDRKRIRDRTFIYQDDRNCERLFEWIECRR